jgi:Cu/Zn superoxide dismutase
MRRRDVLSWIGAAVAGFAFASCSPRSGAQEAATPAASPAATPVGITTAVLIDAQQRRIGAATVTEGADGEVTVSVDVEAGSLEPGPYALFFHETGICEPGRDVPFSSAGGFDPDGPSEALAEVVVEASAPGAFEVTTDAVSLDALSDRDGSALVFHAAGEEPEGGATAAERRVACGVVYPPSELAGATPVSATPVSATPAAEATPAGAEAAAEVTVEMVDIDFNPNEFSIPANTDVTVRLPNLGAIPHNFHIDPLDVHSEDVPPEAETTVTINAEPGDYEYYCSIPGHREAGMVGTVHVE